MKHLRLTDRLEAMRAVRPLLTALLVISACTSPVPTGAPSPRSTEAVVATPTLVAPSLTPSPRPSASSTPSPSEATITCLPETAPLPSGLQGDPCPSAIAAVRAVVAPLGQPIARMYMERGPFGCGDLWPGVGSPIICFGPIVLPGTSMHGWVTFIGTDKVAAVELHRVPNHPWTPALRAFVVPPAGWVMP